MDDILSQIIAYSPNKIDTETKARAMVQEPRNIKLAQVPRSEMDNFNTPDLDQGADSILKPGETLEDFDVEFRRPNAQGGVQQLVSNTVDGSRPGYKGETEKETLKNFIDNYKKKNKTNTIDTTILARKVEDLFKVENGPKKLASLRKHNPDIFKETKIVYGIKGQGPWNDAWKNNSEFRKFFKEKNPGVKWEDLTTDQRFLKSGAWKAFNTKQNISKNVPKNFIRAEEFAEKIGVKPSYIKSVRGSSRYNDLNKKLENIVSPKKYNRILYFPNPSQEQIKKYKNIIDNFRDKGLESMKTKKRLGSIEPIKALHKELMIDPDATPRELAEAIYGKSDAKTLQFIGNDASKYTEFLTGSRDVPGIKNISIEKTEDILGNILNRGGFFNFGNAERRNSMLMERDKILGTKGPKLATLRKKLMGPGKQLDEAMGLASTYERAPGYTELAQKIDPEINLLKGNTVDRDFSILFEKVLNKKEGAGSYRGQPYKNLKEHINLFNKFSKNFQKDYKVDTPIIEYKPGEKLNASRLIKNFDKLSSEAKVNISDLAKQGIVLKSKAMPMGAMVDSLTKPDLTRLAVIGCGRKAAFDGGRINFNQGQNLTACAMKGVEKLQGDPGKLTPGDQANVRALAKSGKAVKFLKGVLGPGAILSEVLLEGGIAANKFMNEGMPIKQALGESYINKYLLGPKTQIDVEAERAKEFAKGEDFAMAERGRRMFLPEGAPRKGQLSVPEERRLKDRMKQMEEVKTYENFKPNYGFTKEEFEDTMRQIGSLKEDQVYRDDFYKQQVEKPIEFKQLMELPSFKGTQEEFMQGGIASLNVKK